VFADFILARGPVPLDAKRKEKIAQFCNVRPEHVISAPDVKSVYDVPLNFEEDQLSRLILNRLGLPVARTSTLAPWKKFVTKVHGETDTVTIGVVGKYFSSGDFILSDVYLSVLEAIKYSAYALNLTPDIRYVSSLPFTDTKKLAQLREYDGVLVPGGFGTTGVEGMIKAIGYARTHQIPFFGICYGMQLAVVEYARSVLKLRTASTEEIDPASPHQVIGVMPDQREKIARGEMGGTMRLGEYPCVLKPGTIAARAYRASKEQGPIKGATGLTISERHRHRYEVNPAYVDRLSAAGLVFSGTSPDGRLMEIVELPEAEHPFFVGAQFHPEFHARPLSPQPLFTAFVKAAYENKRH
jgi:CTP synthase